MDLNTSIEWDCTITYKGKPLEGQTLIDYQTDKGCQADSDATIAHEQVHRMHCLKAYSEDPAGASALLERSEMVAESELQAWTAHQKVLAKARNEPQAPKSDQVSEGSARKASNFYETCLRALA